MEGGGISYTRHICRVQDIQNLVEEECPFILPSLSGNLLLWTQTITTILRLINFTWVGLRMYKIIKCTQLLLGKLLYTPGVP